MDDLLFHVEKVDSVGYMRLGSFLQEFDRDDFYNLLTEKYPDVKFEKVNDYEDKAI